MDKTEGRELGNPPGGPTPGEVRDSELVSDLLH